MPASCLLVVDVQNDFVPGGALAVPGGDEVVPVINRLVARFEHVIPMFECRRYKWLPPLKWLLWEHFKDSGTLGALLRKR